MSSKVSINGLNGLHESKRPIDAGKPFVVQYDDGGDYVIVAVCQIDKCVSRLVAIIPNHDKYWLNRTNEEDLWNAVLQGKLREYLEDTLKYKVIDCDIDITINIT